MRTQPHAVRRIGDLAITPTRLQLIRDVGDGNVWQGEDGQSWLILERVPARKVTTEMAAFHKAGAVLLGAGVKVGPKSGVASPWVLTDVARQLLDEVDGET